MAGTGSDAPAGQGPSTSALVLPWMRMPQAVQAEAHAALHSVKGLDHRLAGALQQGGYSELLPVQTAAWSMLAGGHSQAHDLCLCAPTGSGKTLAYALPIVQALARHQERGPRALLVLPTQDLAQQVFHVFAGLCPAMDLTVGLASGRHSLAAEASALAGLQTRDAGPGSQLDAPAWLQPPAVDILVATPGRLMHHLQALGSPLLGALRFLVVDEADRLLRQSYHNWLPHVMAAIATPPDSPKPRVLKILVSATLTRNPLSIERLGLHCPRYVVFSRGNQRHRVPKELKEFKLICDPAKKPATLLALLQTLQGQKTIIFLASLQAAHRLALFLMACKHTLPDTVVEYSSLVPPKERRKHLQAFQEGAARVLVASDAMTRGMDVPGVENVVNYDVPAHATTYLHRIGRTARAGKAGRAITLLKPEDLHHFKALLHKLDNAFVRQWHVNRGSIHSLETTCEQALAAMQKQLSEM